MADESSGKPALWRNLSFTLMWTSTAASGFGDRMIMLGALALLGGMVAGVDSTSTQASTQFWFFLPYIGFSVVGGWLADHLPRKWLLLVCDESRGVILLLSCWMVSQMSGSAAIDRDALWFTLPILGTPVYQVWKVYGTLFAIGTFASIFNPTRNAIVPQIVPSSQLTIGNAVILVINVIASQIGLLIGQRIVSQEDASTVQTGLMLGAAFYMISGTFFAFLKPIQTHAGVIGPGGAPKPRSFLQSAKYLLQHRRVMMLIGINVLIWPSAAVVTSALFGLGKMHYQLEGEALLEHFAHLSVTMGVGMLLGAALVSFIRIRREAPMVYLTGLMAAGLGILVLAAVPVLTVAYVACLLIGIGGNVAIVSVLTLLQSVTPNYMRGRVMGLNALLNTIFSVMTYWAIWQLPDADRNIASVMFVLGPALILIGLYALIRQTTQGPMPTRTLNVVWRFNRLFCLVWHRLKVVNLHHIPSNGPMILASNHTAGIDPLIMQVPIQKLIKWIMFRNYRFRLIEPFWKQMDPITLDLNGSDIGQIRAILKALKKDCAVGLFPEGRLQRDVRELQEFRPGIGMIARRTGATIVPVWIHGTPATKNMLWHFLLPSRSTVIYGNPYKPDPSMTNEEIVHDLRERLIALAQTV
jgi:1-acyl-sn-glycerol-3-phosphate acyltransferase